MNSHPERRARIADSTIDATHPLLRPAIKKLILFLTNNHSAVSPRESTRREIQRFITTDHYHVLKRFEGALLMEIRVGKGSIAAGHMVHEVKWPAGVVLVGQLRGIHADVPGPDEVLLPGDHLYAVVAQAALKAFVKLLEE